MKAKKPLRSSGAVPMNSWKKGSTSSVRSSGHNIGPAHTFATSCSWSVKEVTTPKLPPPPRIAQKRSGCSSAFAVTNVPSARTMSTSRKLSMVSPHLRVRCPTPPPSPRPPRPVVEMMPPGAARPKAWVAWSTSPRRAPPPATAVRASGSTRTPRMPERSMTRPSSTLPRPPPLWPPPRIAMSRPCSRPNATAAITSATSLHRTMTAGCLSIMALYNARASS